MVSVKECEEEREMQREQQATEGDTLAYFEAQCRLSSMQSPLDSDAEKLYDYANEYAKQIGRVFDGTKLIKIPTGYYDTPSSLGKYLEMEFARNFPSKDQEQLRACQIHSFYDKVTEKISQHTQSIVDFRIITFNELSLHIFEPCPHRGRLKIF